MTMLFIGRAVCAFAGAAALVSIETNVQAAMPDAAPDCGGASMALGEVARVIDGKSFLLADGREVRLAAIESPPLSDAGQNERSGAALSAKAALEALILHRAVVGRLAADADRYGRLIAYVFLAGPSSETFVEAGGNAMLSPAVIGPACRAFLRAAEGAARAARLGLWGDPYYGVKEADNTADILAQQGRFVVVEGKVASVRERGGLVYVNFGRRWSEDFTVTILKRNERLFAGAGLIPGRLAGRRIEVRGFVEARGGPAIEAARPEQIEFATD
jgi:endonuclease YncB( thermonuclease family)